MPSETFIAVPGRKKKEKKGIEGNSNLIYNSDVISVIYG